jgi:hypothetical protein
VGQLFCHSPYFYTVFDVFWGYFPLTLVWFLAHPCLANTVSLEPDSLLSTWLSRDFSVDHYPCYKNMDPWHAWNAPMKIGLHSCSVTGYWSLWLCVFVACRGPEVCCLRLTGQKAVKPVWCSVVLLIFTLTSHWCGHVWKVLDFYLYRNPTSLPTKNSHIFLKQSQTPKTLCIIYRAEDIYLNFWEDPMILVAKHSFHDLLIRLFLCTLMSFPTVTEMMKWIIDKGSSRRGVPHCNAGHAMSL